MASTKLIAEEHATGKTKNIYEEIKSRLEAPVGPKHAGFGFFRVPRQIFRASLTARLSEPAWRGGEDSGKSCN